MNIDASGIAFSTGSIEKPRALAGPRIDDRHPTLGSPIPSIETRHVIHKMPVLPRTPSNPQPHPQQRRSSTTKTNDPTTTTTT
jgi:hypothetical protein